MVSLMASDCLLPQVNITSARLFYMGALIIGYFVIFNLFIAILLDSFGGDGEGETIARYTICRIEEATLHESRR